MEKTTFGMEVSGEHPYVEGFEYAFAEMVAINAAVKSNLASVPLENGEQGYVDAAVAFVNSCAEQVERHGAGDVSVKEAIALYALKTKEAVTKEDERMKTEHQSIAPEALGKKHSVADLPTIKVAGAASPDNIGRYPELTEHFVDACAHTVRKMDKREQNAEKALKQKLAQSSSQR